MTYAATADVHVSDATNRMMIARLHRIRAEIIIEGRDEETVTILFIADHRTVLEAFLFLHIFDGDQEEVDAAMRRG